jgi:hypothetical protein
MSECRVELSKKMVMQHQLKEAEKEEDKSRENFCPVCKMLIKRWSRHIKNFHKDLFGETDIEAIELMKNAGNHMHNIKIFKTGGGADKLILKNNKKNVKDKSTSGRCPDLQTKLVSGSNPDANLAPYVIKCFGFFIDIFYLLA